MKGAQGSKITDKAPCISRVSGGASQDPQSYGVHRASLNTALAPAGDQNAPFILFTFTCSCGGRKGEETVLEKTTLLHHRLLSNPVSCSRFSTYRWSARR